MNIKFTLLFLVLCVFQTSAFSQTYLEYISILTESEELVLENMKAMGYALESTSHEEGCITHSLKLEEKTTLINSCTDEEGLWINFQLMNRDLDSHLALYNEVLKDSSLTKYTSTVGSSTAFVFDSDHYEFFFVFDHYLNHHVFGGANHFRFDMLKEHVETNLKPHATSIRIQMIREMMSCENKDGKTIEDVLHPFKSCDSLSVLLPDEAHTCLEEIKVSSDYDEMKKLVRKELLDDEQFMQESLSLLTKMATTLESDFVDPEQFDEILLKIAIETNTTKSLAMLQFIINSALNQR